MESKVRIWLNVSSRESAGRMCLGTREVGDFMGQGQQFFHGLDRQLLAPAPLLLTK